VEEGNMEDEKGKGRWVSCGSEINIVFSGSGFGSGCNLHFGSRFGSGSGLSINKKKFLSLYIFAALYLLVGNRT
jgi:hypothetical protein